MGWQLAGQVECRKRPGLQQKKANIALNGTPSQCYGTSTAIWDHSVNCHPTQVNVPRLTPAMQVGTQFTYPGGMEDRVDPAPLKLRPNALYKSIIIIIS